MAETKIIGHGTCARCGGPTDITLIQSFPFPEEQTSETLECCTNCGSEVERSYSSSNATTNQLHAFDQAALKEKIGRTLSEILELEKSGRLWLQEKGVAAITRGLSLAETILVYEALSRLEKAEMKRTRRPTPKTAERACTKACLRKSE